jgi:hypothetical protein
VARELGHPSLDSSVRVVSRIISFRLVEPRWLSEAQEGIAEREVGEDGGVQDDE